MRTKVVNIDGLGICGIEKLIHNNPQWQLITCGQSTIHQFVSGRNSVVNFAVFRGEDEAEFIE